MEVLLQPWFFSVGRFAAYYLFLAAFVTVLTRKWARAYYRSRKLQPAGASPQKPVDELLHSSLAILIITACGTAASHPAFRPYLHVYTDLEARGKTYWVITVIVLIVLHDSYFYWTHRLLHWGPLYRWVHSVHHRSKNPTAWASFSFHPVEAFIQAVFPIPVSAVIPLHSGAMHAWIVYMIVMNIVGHCGYELFPLRLAQARWIGTSTRHNLHHQTGRHFYGLYLNLWDWVMHTEHPSLMGAHTHREPE